MSEKEAIEQAYGDAVGILFKGFSDDFTAANGSPNAEEGAKERFRAGIKHLRQARTVALEILP